MRREALTSSPETAPTRQPSIARTIWRWLRRGILLIVGAVVSYLLIVLIGLVPINNDFEESAEGVEILVTSSAVHADLILPISHESLDWREHFPAACFVADSAAATHVAIGWGDKGFYIKTPTWNDLKASTAAHALLVPSDTCVHVSLVYEPRPSAHSRSIRISERQYADLCEYVLASLKRGPDGGCRHIIGAAYGRHDAFFAANGNYHCLNTCNSWAGRALAEGGVRTPWLTPLPKTVFMYLD